MKLSLISMKGKAENEIKVSDEIFKSEMNEHIINETLNWYLASARTGNACAKTRAEVSGGGRKPWRQKGTGRARIGDNRAPHWRKGGVVFAPKPRDYSFSLPIKIRKAAIRIMLSELARSGKIKVIDNIELSSPKTKEMVKLLKGLKIAEKALIVLPKADANISRASRNIKGVKILEGRALNVYDLLKHEDVLLLKEAIPVLEEAYK